MTTIADFVIEYTSRKMNELRQSDRKLGEKYQVILGRAQEARFSIARGETYIGQNDARLVEFLNMANDPEEYTPGGKMHTALLDVLEAVNAR